MTGYILLTVVWIIALLGMGFKYFWVYCPKWISSVLYIALGWACVFAFPQLLNTLSIDALVFLPAVLFVNSAGGVQVIYALKLSA